MNKTEFMRLWDIYSGILTETQREFTDLYFNFDLTVSEIAAEKGVTRQAVSECLQTCKKQLEDLEQKLGFAKNTDKISLEISFMLTDLNKWAEDFKTAHPEIKEDIQKLFEILDKDYSDEVNETLKKQGK
ncbi:MAG: hypothetical protein J1G07_06745 [Clostridiales bacterium]|nr:hypothetical protein [Clostridiales bacterium]